MNPKNIWQSLSVPFTVLAPMEDVTDTVFRQIIIEAGRPDVFFTEFTNALGLTSPEGFKKVSHRLKFSGIEKPLIAQIWGNDPESFTLAARYISSLGFDGIDINMSCPVKKVTKSGCGAALSDNPELALRLIRAVREGAGTLPVSVKTRLGNRKTVAPDFFKTLLGAGIDALTVHARRAVDMSKVPADWSYVRQACDIRDRLGVPTKIIGNGDVVSLDQAREYARVYHADGIMIGRGIFADPWIFNPASKPDDKIQKTALLSLLHKHICLFDKVWGGEKPYKILKKYFKIYIRGFDGAREIREKFMETDNFIQARKLLSQVNSGGV